jgi:hypothetical protein
MLQSAPAKVQNTPRSRRTYFNFKVRFERSRKASQMAEVGDGVPKLFRQLQMETAPA